MYVQVTFTKYALPAVLGNSTTPGDAYLNVTLLSTDLFPNWCGGECGCNGVEKRGASRFLRHDNLRGHLTTGRQASLNDTHADVGTEQRPSTSEPWQAGRASKLPCCSPNAAQLCSRLEATAPQGEGLTSMHSCMSHMIAHSVRMRMQGVLPTRGGEAMAPLSLPVRTLDAREACADRRVREHGQPPTATRDA